MCASVSGPRNFLLFRGQKEEDEHNARSGAYIDWVMGTRTKKGHPIITHDYRGRVSRTSVLLPTGTYLPPFFLRHQLVCGLFELPSYLDIPDEYPSKHTATNSERFSLVEREEMLTATEE